MLFNSPEFLFGFLPITFAGFFLIARRNHMLAKVSHAHCRDGAP